MLIFMTSVVAFLIFVIMYLLTTINGHRRELARYDGSLIVIVPEDGPKVFSLQLNGDPEDLIEKDYVKFQILPEPSLSEVSE